MSMLEAYLDRTVELVTNDGRVIVGVLRGVDQTTNAVIEESHERVYTPDGVSMVPLGLYIVRGDNVAVIGELDEEKDKSINFNTIRADPLGPVVH